MSRPLPPLPPVGTVFNKLTVVAVSEPYLNTYNRTTYDVKCICTCGNFTVTTLHSLKTGGTGSCGCARGKPIHGGSQTKLYYIWAAMLHRCRNSNNLSYHNYGGKGIRVYQEWNNFKLFSEWSYSNGYSEGLTIHRLNPAGNYEPSNCAWVTLQDNLKAKARKIKTSEGFTFDSANEAAAYYEVSVDTIRYAIEKELSVKGDKLNYVQINRSV